MTKPFYSQHFPDIFSESKQLSVILWTFLAHPRPSHQMARDGRGSTVEDIEVVYDGNAVHERVISPVKQGGMYLLNRHAQVTEESKIVIRVKLRVWESGKANIEVAIKSAL